MTMLSTMAEDDEWNNVCCARGVKPKKACYFIRIKMGKYTKLVVGYFVFFSSSFLGDAQPQWKEREREREKETVWKEEGRDEKEGKERDLN